MPTDGSGGYGRVRARGGSGPVFGFAKGANRGEREPNIEVWGASSSGAASLVWSSPEAESLLSIFIQKRGQKLGI